MQGMWTLPRGHHSYERFSYVHASDKLFCQLMAITAGEIPPKVVEDYDATWWIFWNHFQHFFYNRPQWAKFPMGRNIKIKNHRILDVYLESTSICAKFGGYRSKTKKN